MGLSAAARSAGTRPPPLRDDPTVGSIRLSEVVASLSYALDITEGQPEGHAVRSCLIGMQLAEAIGLPAEDRSALFYALLLKDLGCSSNAAKIAQLFQADDRVVKRDHKTTAWTEPLAGLAYVRRNALPHGSALARTKRVVEIALGHHGGTKELIAVRCDRGARIAADIGFSAATSDAIRGLDEHWDGNGEPLGLAGEAIPILARILQIAQTTEVYASAHGPEAAVAVALQRRGTWFDPALVDVFVRSAADASFWQALRGEGARARVAALEPDERILLTDDAQLDRVAHAFADVIDAKSPWTYRHSTEVARYAAGIAGVLGYAPAAIDRLRRAALLHDIGKLGVSSLILDKPGRLSDLEMSEVRRHPAYTLRILERVASFRDLAELAAMHHERLDGLGYHRGLVAAQLPQDARVLALADQFEALSADRPYRATMTRSEVLAILAAGEGTRVDAALCEALRAFLATS
ncbi:MAG: HD domain-containing protein [Trueperaceae bacterium]|nr:HD domain-containing protein [Trueperaceae bacterium]